MQFPLQFLDPATVLLRASTHWPPAARRGRRSRPASRHPAPPDTALARGTRRCASPHPSPLWRSPLAAAPPLSSAGLPAPDPLAKASARQRSSVATLIPTSCDTTSTAELSGGNSRATIRSLYACPYRATFCYPRPQGFRSYLGGNFSDTGGRYQGGVPACPACGRATSAAYPASCRNAVLWRCGRRPQRSTRPPLS